MISLEEEQCKSYAKAESQDLEMNKKMIRKLTESSIVHGLRQDLANILWWLHYCETILLF